MKQSFRLVHDTARRLALEAVQEAARLNLLGIQVPVELGGRDGLEPVRYGDWEKKGLAIDF